MKRSDWSEGKEVAVFVDWPAAVPGAYARAEGALQNEAAERERLVWPPLAQAWRHRRGAALP